MGAVNIFLTAIFCFFVVMLAMGGIYILMNLSTSVIRFIEAKSHEHRG